MLGQLLLLQFLLVWCFWCFVGFPCKCGSCHACLHEAGMRVGWACLSLAVAPRSVCFIWWGASHLYNLNKGVAFIHLSGELVYSGCCRHSFLVVSLQGVGRPWLVQWHDVVNLLPMCDDWFVFILHACTSRSVMSFRGVCLVLTLSIFFSFFIALQFSMDPSSQHFLRACVVMARLGTCWCHMYSHVLSQVELVSWRRIDGVSMDPWVHWETRSWALRDSTFFSWWGFLEIMFEWLSLKTQGRTFWKKKIKIKKRKKKNIYI